MHAQASATQPIQAAQSKASGAWTRTSLSNCLALLVPASALSIRMPAIRRWKNCWTDSPGRRVSMPETAFCRQSSWSMAEPASKPSSSSPSAAGPSPASEPESESESEHPSMARLGPDSCLSSVTRKEKSLAPFLPSARGAPAAGAPGVPDPRDAAKGAEAVGTCSTATPAAAPTPAAAAPLDRAACDKR
eukprot:scaffold6732_cov99-Isochrysis_galbana.AAC.4